MSNNNQNLKDKIKHCKNKKKKYYKKWTHYEKLLNKLEIQLENSCQKHIWKLLRNFDYHSTVYECELCGKIS
tara:strand:- start:73 stop:288 length:216 start_codon:yes stop_codon:yes gene_type:complete